MKLTLLSQNDIFLLFEFEKQNRAWFEQFIAGRGEKFYTTNAVSNHIEESLKLYEQGQMYPALVWSDNTEILARANIRNIDLASGIAEIGYRVAKSAIGQGVATFAVSSLCQIANKELGLLKLNAMVLDNNPASDKVLVKNGFRKENWHIKLAQINGTWFDGFEYQLALA